MNRIYLVGLPGAGKTHVAELLAARLNWSFMDLDAMMEKEYNQTIEAQFDTEGEEVFRIREGEVLRKTGTFSKTVVSCGGGTPAWNNNMEWMQRNGLTIFLNPPIENIVPRILQNKKKRPMFRGMKEGQIRKKLHDFVDKRGEFYSKAQLIWNKPEENDLFYDAVNQLLSLYSAPA